MLENSSNVVYGFSGLKLTAEEVSFFNKVKPTGFILFARNVDNPQQVRQLVSDLRDCVGWQCPILIDQEGGRVARLKPPHWQKWPAVGEFAKIAEYDFDKASKATYENAASLGKTLIDLGINVDCAPVCDILVDGAHDIIGDRSFGDDPEKVAALARKMAEGLADQSVLPIIKHIPGHGRARVDSHEDLPVVTENLDVLEKSDFKVFSLLKDMPWAMTAHIIYTALDENNPATLSQKVISYIRDSIGYNGVLISDDLSMKALQGSYAERAQKAITAGCDLLLHCNGKMEEMQEVAKGAKALDSDSLERVKSSLVNY